MSEVVYFKITADGTLLETSTTQPPELALTPAPQPDNWYFAFLILLVGIGAFLVAREINPEFMRVMTLARNEQGEWEFTKRRIRSDEY
jgi:p-aminobenzoyl-glutamate transporter AbgT